MHRDRGRNRAREHHLQQAQAGRSDDGWWQVKRALLLVAILSTNAHAWEAETTQAGLAEQAALSSRLHKRLVVLGFEGGLFEQLTVPPADAPTLIQSLKLLSPTHGAVPDARGRQTA